MERNYYIEKVKVKLDEFSPFEEPSSFIAADGDTAYDKVKPVVAYINEELDNAVRFCLNSLPLSLLSADVEKENEVITIEDGVGVVGTSYANKRLVRVKASDWDRDVTHFFTSEDAEYLLQQNKHTRSGVAKPSVFYIPEEETLELYSFPKGSNTTGVNVWSIDTTIKAEEVLSEISDYIVLKCAQLVFNILGNANGATMMENEFTRKLNAE